MHPNPAYRGADAARNIAFARKRAFGTVCVNGDDGPLLSHVPFILNTDASEAELHFVRSNPIARMLTAPAPTVIAASGSDGYISPDWYGVEDQVPTWNYVAVHIRGTLEPLPVKHLRGVIERLSAQMEARLAPKVPWVMDKMTPDVLDRMMRQILPFRLRIERIDGTWKLNQNKADEVRLRAAEAVAEHGIGMELAELSALMRDPPRG